MSPIGLDVAVASLDTFLCLVYHGVMIAGVLIKANIPLNHQRLFAMSSSVEGT